MDVGISTNIMQKYALISPCRDEASCIRKSLDSILAQSVQPAILVVVDDGSSDATPDILAEYAERMPYLRVVRRQDRGGRKVGGGVVDAFNEGLSTIDLSEYAFICKLDMDLDLPKRYFELLIDKMQNDPKLGSCSGQPYYYHPDTGALTSEFCGPEMSVGMTKFYRTECFLDIGGFVNEVGWDGIDCHMCRMHGWKAQSFDDPDLRFVHLRPMGSSHVSIWRGRVRNGRGLWFLGTTLPFMLAIVLYRLNKRPRLVGALGMLVGYLDAMMRGAPRFDRPGYRDFVRRYQYRALLTGKMEAAQWVRIHHAQRRGGEIRADS